MRSVGVDGTDEADEGSEFKMRRGMTVVLE